MRGTTLASIKWAVFLVAALTAVAGIALLVTGIYTLNDTTAVLGQRALPIMLIVLGALVFLISFLGIFGTATDSRGLLYAFLVGLLALITTQLVVGVIALSNNSAVDSLLDSAWDEAFEKHPRVIRDIQESNGCCGFRYVTDRAVPKNSPDACLKSPEFGFQISCYRALVSGYRHTQTAIGVTSIVLAGLQIVAVFLTYTLIQHIPDPKHHRPGTGVHAPLLAGDYYNPYAAPGTNAPPGYVFAPYPYGAIGVPPAPGSQGVPVSQQQGQQQGQQTVPVVVDTGDAGGAAI